MADDFGFNLLEEEDIPVPFDYKDIPEGSFIRGRIRKKEFKNRDFEEALKTAIRKKRLKVSKYNRPTNKRTKLTKVTEGPNVDGKYWIKQK